MAGIQNLVSYELNGVKESFANWISNISPTDTPFVSMTGKESINNKFFQWQVDSLSAVDPLNAYAEGSDAAAGTLNSTEIKKNVTQILRKVVQVSDTADALASYGRGSELAYQMEKAGAELKRDLEFAFLNQGASYDGTGTTGGINSASGVIGTTGTAPNVTPVGTSPATHQTSYPITNGLAFPGAGTAQLNQARMTAGFRGLVDTGVSPDSPGASNVKVVIDAHTPATAQGGKDYDFTEDELFGVTNALYQVGSTANIIMYHPTHAAKFSALMERTSTTGGNRQRMFDGASDTKINTYVSTLVDPLGQEFKLIPNRFMPIDGVYFFDPSDWTQMVLRAPQRIKLAKNGSYERWMIEMEVGLRHRNGFASGILNLKKAA